MNELHCQAKMTQCTRDQWCLCVFTVMIAGSNRHKAVMAQRGRDLLTIREEGSSS